MGRGGRGGGHRSSGGHHSSHRSSGGRSSSHRSRGSSSSHSSWNSSGGGSGSHHIHHHHTGYSNNSAAGCIVFFIIFSFVALSWILSIFEIIALHATQGSSDHITRSTIEREALPKGSVDETGYYTDELGWIDNSYTLETGLL